MQDAGGEDLEPLQQAWEAGRDGPSREALGGALVEALERRVSAGEGPPALHLRLGRLLDELGRTDEAIVHLQRAKQGTAERGAAGHALGVCYMRKRMWTLAVRELEAALEAKGRSLHDRGNGNGNGKKEREEGTGCAERSRQEEGEGKRKKEGKGKGKGKGKGGGGLGLLGRRGVGAVAGVRQSASTRPIGTESP